MEDAGDADLWDIALVARAMREVKKLGGKAVCANFEEGVGS